MKKGIFVTIGLLMLTKICFHTFLAGWYPHETCTKMQCQAPIGLVANHLDNLSYFSWAQQAFHGIYPFENLYTTTKHDGLFINPLFLLIGVISRLLSLSPIAVLNILTLFLIPLLVLSLTATSKRLGRNNAASIMTVIFALGGGGISWIIYITRKLGLMDMLRLSIGNSPDLNYYDLYPMVSFIGYPYHAVFLTILSLLCMVIIDAEWKDQPVSALRVLVIFLITFCLSAVRPYEPITLLISYFLVFLFSCFIQISKTLRQRRMVIFITLLIGTVPWISYNAWLSRQQVWSTLTSNALNIAGTMNWVDGFFLLWIFAFWGIFANRRTILQTPYAVFAIWSAIIVIILIVMQSGLTKFCGGCTLPLAFLSGLGMTYFQDKKQVRFHKVPLWPLIALLAIASPLLAYYRFSMNTIGCDKDLIHALNVIRADSSIKVPTVLTDVKTAEFLPGLACFRVYCGHWGLTDAYATKAEILERVGLPPANVRSERAPARYVISNNFLNLRTFLSSNIFHYILIKENAPIFSPFISVGTNNIIYAGKSYIVCRVDQDLIYSLQPGKY